MKKLFLGAASMLCAAVLMCAPFTVSAAKNLIGDINGDGKVNPIDAAVLERHLAGWVGYENLGETEITNLTMFVVTATPKQYYYSGADGAYNSASNMDEVYVGLQKLVNGKPNGAMLYVTCEDLGIEPESVEDYFNYSVELVNFDETDASFTSARLCVEPAVYTHSEVALVNSTNLKIDDVIYTPVDTVTGSTLRNEIVVYEGSGIYVTVAKTLLTDENGNIINSYGDILARFAYESSSGAKYYYDQASGSGSVISEAAALDMYGVIVSNPEAADFTGGAIITGAELRSELYGQAFEMKLFDDDRDGKYDRAFYNPIYMSVYYTYKANVSAKETDCDGILKNVYGINNKRASDVMYTDEAAKQEGAVSVFTYNYQLNRVNVIDVLEMQTGYINKIDSTKYNTSGYGDIVVTVDGNDYKLGYDLDNNCNSWTSGRTTDGTYLGATLVPYDASSTNAYGVEEVATRPFIQYIRNRVNWIDDLRIGDEIGFYAYNGIIVYASELITEGDEDAYNFAIINDLVNYGDGVLYMDMYIDGELIENAAVTEFNGVLLSELNAMDFAKLVYNNEYYYPGTVYSCIETDGTYNLCELIDEFNYDVYDLIEAKDPELMEGAVEFVAGETVGDLANRIRTNENTVFYFIEAAACDCNSAEHTDSCASVDLDKAVVTVFVGQPDDSVIEYNEATNIWTDKLGYGSAYYNGVASVVIVYMPTGRDGFTADDGEEIVPAVPVVGEAYVMTNLTSNYAQIAEASELGLPEEYEGVYYKYANAAINLDNGTRITIYSKVKLNGNRIYKVDENGVVYLEDALAYGEGVMLMDAPNQQNHNGGEVKLHWFSSKVGSTLNAYRNYVKYGITDVNGSTTSMSSTQWAKPDKKLNYNDYVWYVKATTKERTAALDEYAAELADLVNAAIDAGAADVDVSTIVNSNGNQAAVKEFLRPYVEAGRKIDADDIVFEELPTEISGVSLINDVISARYFGNYLCVDLADGTPLIEKSDKVSEIVVVSMSSIGTKWTGEKAVEILNTAPMVMWIGKNGTDDAYGELFEEYISDGIAVFVVIYNHQDR